MNIYLVKLNNGVEIPILRFGVYQVDPSKTERVVSDAQQVSYHSIDTVANCTNEEAVELHMQPNVTKSQ